MGELMHGAYKSVQVAENLAQIDALLAAVTILPCDEGTTRRFGLLKAQLEQTGMRLSDLDPHIASIVLQYGAPLVTPNQSYFIRVPGLVIEDWLK
ncbi:MAG: PIN domain nuclease [Chloroflexota bacterium]